MVNFANAQAFTSTWALTGNGNVATTGNVSASSLGIGSGLNGLSYSGNGASTGSWSNNSNSLVETEYYEFKVSPINGFALNVTSINFQHSVNAGTWSVQAYYSTDNFVTRTPISTVFNSTNTVGNSNTPISIPSISSTLTIRIYGWRSGANNRSLRIRNFVVSGNTTCLPSPTTTDVSICQGGSGALTATLSGATTTSTTFSGSWNASLDLTANMPNGGMVIGDPCLFSSTVKRNYTAVNFIVSQTGSYTFKMTDDSAFDGMAYIYTGAFTPGSCGSGTWIVGADDDVQADREPRLVANLTAGTVYTLISTTWANNTGTYSGNYTWTVTPPSSGQLTLSTVNWYTAASGGNPIWNGSVFNPAGVTGSGVGSTPSPGAYTFYASSGGASCPRTPATFTVNATPTLTGVSQSTTACIGSGATINLTGLVANSTSTISYSINGTAQPNVTSVVATPSGTASFTTSALTAANNGQTLRVTGITTSSNCSQSFTNNNSTTLTVNAVPTTANAGPDQMGNSTSFTLAANAPTVGTGAWSVANGPSTLPSQFSSTTSHTATFTPAVSGTYVLNWTISNGGCTSTDQVVISTCVTNLIKNGDFSFGTDNWARATTMGTTAEVLNEDVYFGTSNTANRTAELDSEASLRQDVTVVPNVSYTLSFIYARRPGSPASVAVDVKLFGGSTASVNYTTNVERTPFIGTLTFTPTTSSVGIEFYNSLGGNSTLGAIVDNIVLLPSSLVTPIATTDPKGNFGTLSACAGVPIKLNVENVTDPNVTYAWTSTSPGAVFSSTTIKNPTITFTGSGIQNATVTVTKQGGGCAGAPSTTYVNVKAAPTVYNVTGGGSYCSGGTGLAVNLSGSAASGSGVTYQLQLDGVDNGAPVAATGSAINFGVRTVAGTYTVIAKNAENCSLSMNGSAVITVNPNNTITLNSDASTTSQTVCINNPITNITYNTTGATNVTFSGLPNGVTGGWAGNVVTISGTPTESSATSFTYTVTLEGGCGNVTATGTIRVNPNNAITLTSATGTDTQTVCANTAITDITYNTTGATGVDFGVLPDGLSGIWSGNVATITGTPTVSSATPYNYTVTLSGGCGNISATGTITVKQTPTAPSITKNGNAACNTLGSITITGLLANWTVNQTGTTTLPKSYPVTDDGSLAIQDLVADTYYFTVTNEVNCTSSSSSVTITDTSSNTEWNGSGWSNDEPDGSKSVTISSVDPNQPFSTAKPNIAACSLTITAGADVIVPEGVTLTITNKVTSNGRLVFESGSSLLQTTNVQNEGEIVYRRATKINRFDLTYWSSPVTGETEDFKMQDLSPTTLFDKFFRFSPTGGWETNMYGTDPMKPGYGYSIRGPQEFDSVDPRTFVGEFTGRPNNGDITVPSVVPDKWFLLGNPYPSAIDVDALWDANQDKLGALYFWTHVASPKKDAGENIYRYASNDYVVYTATGSTDISGANPPKTFEGYIAAGQGFFTRPKGTEIHFNNDMRRGASVNGNFFKVASKSKSRERNRIWLNLRNAEGAFKQILVGYIEGATNSVDFNYDAITLGGNSYVDFYSLNDTKKLTIQGRALPFDNTDLVPLGYKTTVAGDFTIGIDHGDGFFDKQEIYLEDKTTGKTTNLRNENYTFNTLAGTFADRFVLRYTGKTLGTDDLENVDNSVLISVKNKIVSIICSKETIKEVNVFNVGAQLLYSKNKVNSSELHINNLHSSDQVILVKVTLENGSIVTKKVIFSNL